MGDACSLCTKEAWITFLKMPYCQDHGTAIIKEFRESIQQTSKFIDKKGNEIEDLLTKNKGRIITTKLVAESLKVCIPSAIKVTTKLKLENKLLPIKHGVWAVA